MKEQVALYGTLTGRAQPAPREERQTAPMPSPRSGEPGAATWSSCRARRRGRRARRLVSRVAVLKGGRSLERQVSLRSGARVEDALERLGHEVVAIDVGVDLIRRLREEAPDVAFVALHGRDGEDGTVQELLEILGIPYTGSGVLACSRAMDKVLTKHLLLEAGIPTPEFFAFNETAFRELGAAEALPAIEERLDFPIVVKPSRQGSALGIKFARTAADVPAALVAAFSYDARVLLERHVEGRDLAVSILDGTTAGGAADRRGRAARRGLLRLRGALRDRPHRRSSARRSCPPGRPSGRSELALDAPTGCSASTGSGGST